MFHLSEPARPRGPVPLHQRQPVLRTRQTHSAHQRPFEFTADEPAAARPEGKTPMMAEGAPRFFVVSFQSTRQAAKVISQPESLAGKGKTSVIFTATFFTLFILMSSI